MNNFNCIFFHASNIGGLQEVQPLSKMHGGNEKVCFFAPSRVYALFYLRDMEINHVTCGVGKDGIPVYHEQFPSQLSKIYSGRSGYLYSCEKGDLIKQGHTAGVWIATEPVKIVESEYIDDVYAEIVKAELRGEARVIRYQDLTDGKKKEISEMIKNSILKNRLLYSVTAKSLFFKQNFPEAWQAAEAEGNMNLQDYQRRK
ncbi:MAG: hypothetical protein PHV32_10920 [Eubacteriales bacterium]|nr:hypothetical protein [Oscillospiraceae bacterium]MDD4494835.1 hypothetical protein [Eubacteriales bacterium]